jgi:hypothetical protein
MARILADHQYNLNSFYKISKEKEYAELSDSIINIINRLSEKVGAPTYKKTPVFKTRTKGEVVGSKSSGGVRNRRRNERKKTRAVITAEDWETIRNFKTTKLEKSEEKVDKDIELLTMNLNKLTEMNYEEIRDSIKNILENIIKKEASEEDLNKIGHEIFQIGSVNKFWSKLYARLFNDIIKSYPTMNDICKKNFSEFMHVFDNIRCGNPDEDYDMFCTINKENEKRKALSAFFCELTKQGIIESSELMGILDSLISIFKRDIDVEGRKDVTQEIGENITIMLTKGGDKLEEEDEKWEEYILFVEWVSKLSAKDHVSISSQTIFNFMDLVDELE